MQVQIFKTNVRNKKQVSQIASQLSSIQGLFKWNIDLHDVDKILRIEAVDPAGPLVEEKLRASGYACEELY